MRLAVDENLTGQWSTFVKNCGCYDLQSRWATNLSNLDPVWDEQVIAETKFLQDINWRVNKFFAKIFFCFLGSFYLIILVLDLSFCDS